MAINTAKRARTDGVSGAVYFPSRLLPDERPISMRSAENCRSAAGPMLVVAYGVEPSEIGCWNALWHNRYRLYGPLMAQRFQEEVGSGIARRVRRTLLLNPEEPDDAAKIVEWFDEGERARTQRWGNQATLIAAVRTEMERLRVPFQGLLPGTEAFLSALREFNALFIERTTEAWYLREIEGQASLIEVALEAGRHWEAVSRAVNIGDLLAELRLKFEWDADATFGRQNRINLSEGQTNRRRSSKEARFDDVEALLAKRHSLSGACQIAARRHGVKPETLEKDYQRIKKERTTARMLSG